MQNIQPTSSPTPEAALSSLIQAYKNAIVVALETGYTWPEVEKMKKDMDALDISRRASLMGLPAQVLELIGYQTYTLRHLSNLSRTCHKFHSVLMPILYRRDSDSPRGGFLWCWAMKTERDDMIRRLIAAGVNTGELCHLSEAAASGNCAMVEALLGAKSIRDEWNDWYIVQDEPTSGHNDIRDPVCTAIAHRNVAVLKILLDHTLFGIREGFGAQIWLHEAVRYRDIAIIQGCRVKGRTFLQEMLEEKRLWVMQLKLGRLKHVESSWSTEPPLTS